MPHRPAWEVVREAVQDFLHQVRHTPGDPLDPEAVPEWSVERMAEDLQIAPSTLYAYMEPPREENGSGRIPPVNRFLRLAEITGDERTARWLLRRLQAAGHLQDIQEGPPSLSDYSGALIEGEDLGARDLRNVSFREAKLFGVDFSGAALQGASFQGAYILGGCKFDRAKLVDANMQGIQARDVTFVEADIRASQWRKAVISTSSFRDCTHTGADMREVQFEKDVRWLADRYRGGLCLQDADLQGLVGISESHGVLKQLVLNIADGRQHFQGFAGYLDLRIMGCWQAGLHYLETLFTEVERKEVLGAVTANERWLTGIRLDFEYQKRDWLAAEFGGDFPTWPPVSERNKAIEGRPCTVSGIPGRVSRAGLFVPSAAEDEGFEERFETFDVTTDEMLVRALESTHPGR